MHFGLENRLTDSRGDLLHPKNLSCPVGCTGLSPPHFHAPDSDCAPATDGNPQPSPRVEWGCAEVLA